MSQKRKRKRKRKSSRRNTGGIKFSIIAIDYDNTLYDDSKDKVIIKGKKIANSAFEKKDNFVVIYTARPWSSFEEIRKNLNRFEIKYHAIVCEKLRASKYVDDCAEKFKK